MLQTHHTSDTSVSAFPGSASTCLLLPHPWWVAASPSRHSFEGASKMTPMPSQLSRGSSQPAGLAPSLRDPLPAHSL